MCCVAEFDFAFVVLATFSSKIKLIFTLWYQINTTIPKNPKTKKDIKKRIIKRENQKESKNK